MQEAEDARSGASAFSYAILRVVPHVERGEGFNAGVVLFCRQLDFLRRASRSTSAASPSHRAGARPDTCGPARGDRAHRGGGSAGGPIAALPPSERFGWLVAPASTIIQPSAVHTGLCEDPQATLDQLFDDLVA